MADEDSSVRGIPEGTLEAQIIEPSHDALVQSLGDSGNKKYIRFVLAALSSIPWVGGVMGIIGAAADLKADKEQDKTNILQKLWLEEHKEKIKELGITFADIFSRLDNFGQEVQERIESPAYLGLVKKNFRAWDQADTVEKKQMLKKLITNAGALTLCPDDLIRLFIDWLGLYHEAHFAVIKEIYQDPGVTRGEIWDRIHGERPREDSAEADLYRYLIRDLSTGGVIRQARDTDSQGRFMKRHAKKHSQSGHPSSVMESAFEETKPYVLTELGSQFVHYVMEDVVTALEQPTS